MEESLDDVTETVVESDAGQPQDTGEPLTAFANEQQVQAIREAFKHAGEHEGLPPHWPGMVLAALIGDVRQRVKPKELTFEQASTLLSGGPEFLASRIVQTVQSMWPEQTQPAQPVQEPTPQNPEPQPETNNTKENQQ